MQSKWHNITIGLTVMSSVLVGCYGQQEADIVEPSGQTWQMEQLVPRAWEDSRQVCVQFELLGEEFDDFSRPEGFEVRIALSSLARIEKHPCSRETSLSWSVIKVGVEGNLSEVACFEKENISQEIRAGTMTRELANEDNAWRIYAESLHSEELMRVFAAASSGFLCGHAQTRIQSNADGVNRGLSGEIMPVEEDGEVPTLLDMVLDWYF